jgi:hypothetical protein
MAFDAAVTSRAPTDTAAMIEAALAPVELCPVWTAANPDRALAFLYVQPMDCAAVDVLTAG